MMLNSLLEPEEKVLFVSLLSNSPSPDSHSRNLEDFLFYSSQTLSLSQTRVTRGLDQMGHFLVLVFYKFLACLRLVGFSAYWLKVSLQPSLTDTWYTTSISSIVIFFGLWRLSQTFFFFFLLDNFHDLVVKD